MRTAAIADLWVGQELFWRRDLEPSGSWQPSRVGQRARVQKWRTSHHSEGGATVLVANNGWWSVGWFEVQT